MCAGVHCAVPLDGWAARCIACGDATTPRLNAVPTVIFALGVLERRWRWDRGYGARRAQSAFASANLLPPAADRSACGAADILRAAARDLARGDPRASAATVHRAGAAECVLRRSRCIVVVAVSIVVVGGRGRGGLTPVARPHRCRMAALHADSHRRIHRDHLCDALVLVPCLDSPAAATGLRAGEDRPAGRSCISQPAAAVPQR